jgi:unspecific monooxygenase
MSTADLRLLDLDPRADSFVQNPYPAYHEIRARSPFFFWEQYGFWCASSHRLVSALLRDRRFGRQILHVMGREELGWPEPPEHLRPFLDVDRHSLLELEPPAHTRLRTLVNRAFVSRQVERLRPRVAALAHGLVDGFEGQGNTELIESFATPVPVIVIAELLGIPAEDAPLLLDWSHRMVAMYQFGRTRSVEEAAATAAAEFAAYLRRIIAERRAAPRDDLVSHLVAAHDREDRLSEDELVSTCILLLNAGHEATVHAAGNGVKGLLEAGLAPADVFRDEATTARAVEEMLRHDPPLHLFTRYALDDVEIEGITVRRGETVGLMLAAANRDPARFEDPDRLDPDRDATAQLSFGAGIHFCIGAPLARLEMQVALPILFARLPRLRLAAPPRYRDSYHFHGLERLDLAW